MKSGDKLICNDNSLLDKGVTYFFDHEDIWDEFHIYVRSKDNFIYYVPKSHLISIKQDRKLKLEKLNQTQ